MSEQWIRNTTVLFGLATYPEAVKIGNDFRIAFSVGKKDGKKGGNVCEVRVWGLSRSTQDLIRRPRSMIQLYAGYGDVVPLLYKGIITRVKIEAEGAEVVTVIESTKGFLTIPRPTVLTAEQRAARALVKQASGYISRVFAPEVSVLDGLKVIAADVKDAAGEFASQIALDFDQVASAPKAASKQKRLAGTPSQVLDGYAAANNLDIWMEDGVLRATPRGASTREQAFVLSPQTGLIGSPQPKKAGKNEKGSSTVELTCLLNGELRVRRAVQLRDTKALSGWYLIRSVSHKGDNEDGDEYYTTLEVTPIKARPAPAAPTKAARAKAAAKTPTFRELTAQVGQRLVASLRPTWPTYGAARTDVLGWMRDGQVSDKVLNLTQRSDGLWEVAAPNTVAASTASGSPTIYPVYKP